MITATVIGAGAWGTALAVILGRNGHRVSLCVRRASQLESLTTRRENAVYLPGVELPRSVSVTNRWNESASCSEVVLIAVPSQFARRAFSGFAGSLRPGTVVVSATKGIEDGRLLTMTRMMAETAPADVHLAALSGPGFAAELARGKPAALVVAAREERAAHRVQRVLANQKLRVYRSADVLGVELAGAAKNVIAIAAGVSDGLDLGSSSRAALITRGLAEITRLGKTIGARAETIAGLAGLGDLVLTCTGTLSRNRSAGLRLAANEPVPASVLHDGEPVAEGIANAKSIRALAERHGVEMPIAAAVYRVLYEGCPVMAMVESLLERELKSEF